MYSAMAVMLAGLGTNFNKCHVILSFNAIDPHRIFTAATQAEILIGQPNRLSSNNGHII